MTAGAVRDDVFPALRIKGDVHEVVHTHTDVHVVACTGGDTLG